MFRHYPARPVRYAASFALNTYNQVHEIFRSSLIKTHGIVSLQERVASGPIAERATELRSITPSALEMEILAEEQHQTLGTIITIEDLEPRRSLKLSLLSRTASRVRTGDHFDATSNGMNSPRKQHAMTKTSRLALVFGTKPLGPVGRSTTGSRQLTSDKSQPSPCPYQSSLPSEATALRPLERTCVRITTADGVNG